MLLARCRLGALGGSRVGGNFHVPPAWDPRPGNDTKQTANRRDTRSTRSNMSRRLIHCHPVSRVETLAQTDEMAEAIVESRPVLGGHGETIIVVEDDPLVRDVVVKILKNLGYAVREAADGRGALRTLHAFPEAVLLLTDVVLPGAMSGLDVARAARVLRPGLKIVFTAGFIPPDVQEVCLRDQSASMIQKPYRMAQLAETLAVALSGQV